MDRVIVGMSGGVDSAVSAYLLKQQGYDVIGVFMKNWNEQQDGECTAAKDFDDVQDACNTIGIPYYAVNFEKEYWDRVFSYFLKEYQAGRTPNPDVLCNQEIKFAAFWDFAHKTEVKYLATGHYARLENSSEGVVLKKGDGWIKGSDLFLCMLKEEQLKNVLFPIGDKNKKEVREIAKKAEFKCRAKKGFYRNLFYWGKKIQTIFTTVFAGSPWGNENPFRRIYRTARRPHVLYAWPAAGARYRRPGNG